MGAGAQQAARARGISFRPEKSDQLVPGEDVMAGAGEEREQCQAVSVCNPAREHAVGPFQTRRAEQPEENSRTIQRRFTQRSPPVQRALPICGDSPAVR